MYQSPSPYSQNDTLFTRSITHDNFFGHVPQSLISTREEKKLDSINTLNPSQLARYYAPNHYVVGYADPAFELGEHSLGLSYHDNVSRKILTRDRHDDLPLLLQTEYTCHSFDDNPSTFAAIDDTADQTGNITGSLYASQKDDVESKSNRDRLISMSANSVPGERPYLSHIFGAIPQKYKPLYPQIPLVETKDPKQQKEWFTLTLQDHKPTLIVNDKEYSILKNGEGKVNAKLSLSKAGLKGKILNSPDSYNTNQTNSSNQTNLTSSNQYDTTDKTINLNKRINLQYQDSPDSIYPISNLDNNNKFEQTVNSLYSSSVPISSQAYSYGANKPENNAFGTYINDSTNISNSNGIDYINNDIDDYNTFREFQQNSKKLQKPLNQQNQTNQSNTSSTKTNQTNSTKSNITETFANTNYESIIPVLSEQYLNALKTRAVAVAFYVRNNPNYNYWKQNWEFLQSNLDKSNLLFQRLNESDMDIAFVVNKGDEIKFRIKDNNRYVPINVYQYVLYHEMAHMSTHELQHTPKFKELLAILSLAGFELGFIDLNRIPVNYYLTNGQPILCRESIKDEIMDGCNHLSKHTKNSEYYIQLCNYISGK